MIIFDLDGTLADCEHRRHFVDPNHHENDAFIKSLGWKPDWQDFYEACDQDKPIEPVIEMFQSLIFENHIRLGKEIQIWSGRCESVRKKTQEWLDKNVWGSPSVPLKMRPIGDNTPEDQLKELWWREYYDSLYPKLDKDSIEGTEYHRKVKIESVFTSNPKEIAMWRRRGVFVFNCCQHDEEF